MTILGLDASTTCTGYGVMINGSLDSYGIIDLKKNKNTSDRLAKMCKDVSSLLTKYKPNIVYIEDAWQGNNPKTMKLLMHVIGTVYGWCVCHDIECVEVVPSSWRKIIGWEIGKKSREELKKLSLKYAAEQYGIISTSDDMTDAICIATAGAIQKGELKL